MELSALESLKILHRLRIVKMVSPFFYLILFILARNENMHLSLDEF